MCSYYISRNGLDGRRCEAELAGPGWSEWPGSWRSALLMIANPLRGVGGGELYFGSFDQLLDNRGEVASAAE